MIQIKISQIFKISLACSAVQVLILQTLGTKVREPNHPEASGSEYKKIDLFFRGSTVIHAN